LELNLIAIYLVQEVTFVDQLRSYNAAPGATLYPFENQHGTIMISD